MNKFKLLVGLIAFDIVITVYAIKYLGAIELNPLCNNFADFIFWKTVLSFICLYTLVYMWHERFFEEFLYACIVMYGGAVVWNLWQIVNYLYY